MESRTWTRTFRLSLASGLLALIALGVALVASESVAGAASASVTVGSPENRFSPNSVTINAGDTVTFTWAAGTHEVDFEGVTPEFDIDADHTSGTTNAFTTPGTYYYYCPIHATEDLATEQHVQANDAMVGKVVVLAASGGTATATTPAGGGATSTPTGSATQQAPGAPQTGTGTASGDGPSAIAVLGWALFVAGVAGAGVLAVATRRR